MERNPMKKSLSFLWESHDPEHGLETITEASEDKSKPKQYYLQGPFLMAEQKNKNGRVYDLEECKKEVERYKKEYIDTNRAIGELGHPKDSITVNERNGCHRIVDMVQDGNLFYGKTLILPTESGKIVQGYLDGGTKMGISTRGLAGQRLRRFDTRSCRRYFPSGSCRRTRLRALRRPCG